MGRSAFYFSLGSHEVRTDGLHLSDLLEADYIRELGTLGTAMPYLLAI